MLRHSHTSTVTGRSNRAENALHDALKRYTDLAGIAQATGVARNLPGAPQTPGLMQKVSRRFRRQPDRADRQIEDLHHKVRQVEHNVYRDLQMIAADRYPEDAQAMRDAGKKLLRRRTEHAAISDLKHRVHAARETLSRASPLPTDLPGASSAIHDAATAFGTIDERTVTHVLNTLAAHDADLEAAKTAIGALSPGVFHSGSVAPTDRIETTLYDLDETLTHVRSQTEKFLLHASEKEIEATIDVARTIDTDGAGVALSDVPSVEEAIKGLNQIVMRITNEFGYNDRADISERTERRVLSEKLDEPAATPDHEMPAPA